MAEAIGTLLLLGASGDLAGRLLLPAFGQLLEQEEDRRGVVLIGAGAEDWDDDTWKERVRSSLAAGGASEQTLERVLATTRYQKADVTRAEDLRSLVDLSASTPAIYFALPPAVTLQSCTALTEVDLPAGTTLVLEKPFGTDEASAASLNRLLVQLVPEEQVHRVDHFLGRSMVLNFLGLRFANRMFEPLWSNLHIESVDIVFDEQLTLVGRARYYDRAGALADMIQSHLLLVMALVAMDPPTAVNALDLRDEMAQVLRSARVWDDDPVAAGRRARYTAGSIQGEEVPDYADEPGVDPSRKTETLTELVMEINNWRWSGVPFRLRSGKGLSDLRKEVVVNFKPTPHLPDGLSGKAAPDRLRVSMGPDRLALDINVNGPGDPLELDRVELNSDLGSGRLPAYGEVLAGVLDGDPLLSVRGDTAEQCWRIVDPVLQAWREDKVGLDTYPVGSTGPADWS